MAKVELTDYMTVPEVQAALKCSRRAVYRAIDRAGRDLVVVELFGRQLIKRSALAVLRAHYYPYYSEAHQAMVKEWGSRGGTAKAANAKKAARRGGRRRAGGNGTSGEQA